MNKEEIELYKNSLKMEQNELAIELIQAYRKLDELENVIYKAIEYIENNTYEKSNKECGYTIVWDVRDLYNILKGSDKR